MTKEQIEALSIGTRLHWDWRGTPARGTFLKPMPWPKGFVVVQDEPGACVVEVPDDGKTNVRVLGAIEMLAEATAEDFKQPSNWLDYWSHYR